MEVYNGLQWSEKVGGLFDSKGGGEMKHPEDDLLMSCVLWFDYQYPLLKHKLHHSPNEGQRSRRRNSNGVYYSPEATRLKRKGCKAGFPDIFLYHPSKGFHGLAGEAKSKRGKLSEAQIGWLTQLSEDNYFTFEFRTLDEFIKIVTNYLR